MKAVKIFFVILFAIFLQGCKEETVDPDTTPPTVSLTFPANNSIVADTIRIRATASDNKGVASVTFLVDGIDIGKDESEPFEILWNPSFWNQDSLHTIIAKATDKSGNTALSGSIEIKFSASTPLPQLVNPAGSFKYQTDTVLFSWRKFYSAATYELQIASNGNFDSSGQNHLVSDTSYKAVGLTPGIHYWRIRATGIQNNSSRWSASRSFVIDTLAGYLGTSSLLGPSNGTLLHVSDSISMSWSLASSASSYQVQLSNQSNFFFTFGTYTVTQPALSLTGIGTGQFYWRVRGKHSNGMAGQWSESREFKIDTAAGYVAVPTLLSPKNDSSFSKTDTVHLLWGSATEAATYELQISLSSSFSGTVTNISTTQSSYLLTNMEYGMFYWRVRVKRSNGIPGYWSVSRRFGIAAQGTTTGLVLHYKFNGNANDSSGNNFHGQVQNATLTSDRFGKPNSAYMFSGNSLISSGDILDSVFCKPEAKFSIAGWARSTSAADDFGRVMIGKSAGGSGPYQWDLSYYQSSVSGGVFSDSLAQNYQAKRTTMGLNQWFHFTLVFDGSLPQGQRLQLYVNANPTVSTTVGNGTLGTTTQNTSRGIVIGATFIGDNSFIGAIDDIRIYNRALTGADVTNVFNSGN